MKARKPARDGGAEGIRTPDPHNAIVVLYQLSYDPIQKSSVKLKAGYSLVKAKSKKKAAEDCRTPRRLANK